MIVPTDMFPRRIVASVAGLVGFGGAMGGIVSNLIAGRMLDLGLGYGTVFSIMGMCHVTAFVVILLTIRRIEPVSAGSHDMRIAMTATLAKITKNNQVFFLFESPSRSSRTSPSSR